MNKLILEILKVFDRHHLFDEGVELIGSWCFLLYQKHLGAKAFPLRTQDIDFLIPNPYRGQERDGFISDLEALGFRCDFRRDGSLYLWNSELKIEFISPEKGQGVEGSIKVKKLGLNAIALRFVNLLLEKPIRIKEGNIDILVPAPAHFCLHKILIASRRKNRDKAAKDLQQALCTIPILNPKDLKAVFDRLPSKWQAVILRVLSTAEKELPLLKEEAASATFTLHSRDD